MYDQDLPPVEEIQPTPAPAPEAVPMEVMEESPEETAMPAHEDSGAPTGNTGSTEVTTAFPKGGLSITGTVEGVQRWAETIRRFEVCRLAAQVMCGFELAAVRKSMGFTRGGDRTQAKEITWEEWVPQHTGISHDTARNYIRMAEAVKPRLKQLGKIGDVIDGILHTPITELPPASVDLLFTAVRKVADGKSQLQLMLELGLTKAPQGSAAKGGNLGGTRSPAETPSDEVMRQIALDDWNRAVRTMTAAGVNFTLLPDDVLEGLVAYLESRAGGMKRWVRATKDERTPLLVTAIREELVK